MSASEVPERFRDPDATLRIGMIASSFELLLRRPLVEPSGDIVTALWEAPTAILAHGTEQDPIFFFANIRALKAFEYDVDTMLRTPSRLSAEATLREERQALLDRVGAQGFIDDYSGVRIASSGRRFTIESAIVWNIIDSAGFRHGQAATFIL